MEVEELCSNPAVSLEECDLVPYVEHTWKFPMTSGTTVPFYLDSEKSRRQDNLLDSERCTFSP